MMNPHEEANNVNTATAAFVALLGSGGPWSARLRSRA